jgi:hypothetical protein
MRVSRTSFREPIGLIESRSGAVVGVCDLVDCVGPLSAAELQENAGKAGFALGRGEEMPYEKTFAWVLEEARRFQTPVPYAHPSGAANDFQALERLRKLAFAEAVPAPKVPVQEVLELVGDEAGEEEDKDGVAL